MPPHLLIFSFCHQNTYSWLMCNTHSTQIFVTATLMQNSHGRTVLDLLIEYWTVSNFIVKIPPTGYLVLNNIGEYIHLLIKSLLNSTAL